MRKSTHRDYYRKLKVHVPLILLCLFMLKLPGALAAQSYQVLGDKVNVKMQHTTAAAVVKALQSQTTYTFIYDPEYLEKCTIREIKFGNGKLADVLLFLDENMPLDIKYADKIISIKKGMQEKRVDKGRVTGKIVNNRNEALPGVTIQASNNTGVVSQVDGTYELPLAPGIYTVTFSFVSFETKKITDVIVKEGVATPLDIVLNGSASSLSGVTVTANYKRASVEGLYALQKNNAALTDGISAEQIARTPDKNIGETLKRVSGLATVDNKYVVVRGLSERYNQALLNGQVMPSTELNRKNFSFDIIPSNIVENVTVIKTLTPDRSAEFGGGLVEVNTLDIPTVNFLNLSVGGSVNSKTNGETFKSLELDGDEYWAKPASHRELLGSGKWNNLSEIVKAYNNSSKDAYAFSNNWGVFEKKAHPSQNYQLVGGYNFGKTEKGQWGAVLSASYRNTMQIQDVLMTRDGFVREGLWVIGPDSVGFQGKRYGITTNLGGLAGIGYRGQKHRVSYNTIYLRTYDQQLLLGTGEHGNIPGLALGYIDMAQQTNMWQNQLKGEHTLGNNGIKLKWLGSYTHLDRMRPDNHFMAAKILDDQSVKSNEYNIGNEYSYLSSGALRWWSRAVEDSWNWDVAMSVPFKFNLGNAAVSNALKVGYAGWFKDRSFYVINLGSGSSDLSYPPLAHYFDPERATVTLSQFNDNFHKKASLHAPFVMLDNKIADKLRLVWGVRAEYYDLNRVNDVLDSLFRKITTDRGRPYDYSALENREKSLHWFPSANLTYSLTPAMNLRLAYAKSIIRPDLRELSFFREYDFELGGAYEAGLLKSTLIDNYDFRYEWYPAPGEILSVSLFYKNMKDPMEVFKNDQQSVFELRNSKVAKNYGLELEARKRLSFINAPVIRNLTLYGNFTYLKSKVTPMTLSYEVSPTDNEKIIVKETIGEEQDRTQAGASTYTVNAGAYFDTKVLSASLVYNWVSNRMLRPALFYGNSQFERPIEALDAQIAFRPLKQLELRLNVSNLLNSFSMVYENYYADMGKDVLGVPPQSRELLYNKGQDKIVYKAMPGRTWSGTITYRF
ncbi:TonB-dependent receptor [uncultured Chitinophaga sp.]|uniref:TonB-dependent receptor domain-containing protein n=1 Tax=uncultured Chitinophaga sp. TaxID=339340 RepID=UPI0025FF3F85|nr:TonB-dependent receptor [uncultured Chitinophaga sp.]